MRRTIRNALKRLLFDVHRLGTRLGLHVLPVHFYSPVPDIVELERTRAVWARKSELPGIDADLDAQAESLLRICLPYQSEYQGNETYRYAVDHAFGPGYGYIEAQALHGVVRYFKPGQVIEVGSGVSTWCMLKALEKNSQETEAGFALTCIEPYPSARLRELAGIELIEKMVQEVAYEGVFSRLGRNDLLFIDSSHTVKPGSDVNYLILEILPRLQPGVIVHFHDIYLPYDYTRDVLQTFFHWMETSLLRAFLIHNPRATVLFCQSQLHYDRKDALRQAFPEYHPQADNDGLRDARYRPFEQPAEEHFPASIYLQVQ